MKSLGTLWCGLKPQLVLWKSPTLPRYPVACKMGQEMLMAGICRLLLGLKDSIEQGQGHASAVGGALRCTDTLFHCVNQGLTSPRAGIMGCRLCNS